MGNIMKGIDKMITKDVMLMTKYVEQFAIRSKGIQPDEYIDKIKKGIRETILVPTKTR